MRTNMSNWHITVNFNDPDESLVDRIRSALEEIVTDAYLWRWLKHFVDGKQETFTPQDCYLVESVDLSCSFEQKGAHNKGVHVHCLLEVMHTTNVQIHKGEFCKVLYELVGKTPNVHMRLLKGNSEDTNFILRYITKETAVAARNQQNRELQAAFAQGPDVEAANLAPQADSN